MRKKFAILILCTFQIFIISVIGYDLFLKKNILGVSINPVNSDNIIIRADKNLAHFYEYKPNSHLGFTSYSFQGDFGSAQLNDDSLNELFNYPIEKEPTVFRIVTLGDSFTFGWFVNTWENYPEQLEAKLNTSAKCDQVKLYEVINLGVGGYDIEYAAHKFDVRGKKYNPDLILWLVQANDFNEITDYISIIGSQNYKKISKEGRLEFYRQLGITTNPGWYEAKKELNEKIGEEGILNYQMDKLYSISQIYNRKLVVFTIGTIFPEANDRLIQFAKDRPQTWFYNSIPKMVQPEEAFPDKHPTPKGYTKIVNYLFDYLATNKILPCAE